MSSFFPKMMDTWGTMLLFSCFLQAGLVFGTLRSFGIFFPEFVEYFGSPAGSVSWVTSCAVAVQQLMSPLGCALALRFGSRPVVILGGFLSSLGLFLASLSTELYQLYLSIGGVSGLGWALIFSPSMAAVTCYFSRWLCDRTGDFSMSFLLSGSFLLLGAFIILTLPEISCRSICIQAQRTSRTPNDEPPVTDGAALANGYCECRVEQLPSDSPVFREDKAGADVSSSEHWPPQEEGTGHSQDNGKHGDRCHREADQTLLECQRLSPVTSLPLSSGSAVLS